jgi:hypothetical protein
MKKVTGTLKDMDVIINVFKHIGKEWEGQCFSIRKKVTVELNVSLKNDL